MTGWADEGRAVDVVYLHFSKAFDTISIVSSLGRSGSMDWMSGQ